jgi:hypothetical protein
MIIKLLGALNNTLKDIIWFMLMLVEKGAPWATGGVESGCLS